MVDEPVSASALLASLSDADYLKAQRQNNKRGVCAASNKAFSIERNSVLDQTGVVPVRRAGGDADLPDERMVHPRPSEARKWWT
jgi:hypothetical protein